MDTSSLNSKFILFCLLCTIMFSSVMSILKVNCNEKDMNTLLHFKQGVVDPSGLLSSWYPKQDCCEWSGVKCDNITGRVMELNLPCQTDHYSVVTVGEESDKSHCLTGEFSLSLLELEFLSYLNLSNNDFKTIKKCDGMSRVTLSQLCGNSSNLHYLDLSYNSDILIDNLNWISHLSSLQYLNLGGIDLHKEIDWLGSMTMLPSLSELHMDSCQLVNIYPSLQYVNFTSLEVLNLANNNFASESLPSWLFNLSCHIFHIDLSQNHIHGQLSKIFSNHRSIKSLDLSQNYLKGTIPHWLGQLEGLQELNLFENYFSGPIPTSLGNLSSLVTLKLYSNYLNGNFPESLGQLYNLEQLVVDENSLTGIVSERNFASLSNLKLLSIGSPSLIFDFDPQWVPPFQLLNLGLFFMRDKLPSWLFIQSSLKSLTITDSSASFEPLDKLWNFSTQLEFFSLSNNTINGDMSNVFLNSKITWLSYNNLKGGLPRLSPNVLLLNLAANSLSGSISSLLCHNMTRKSNLVYLNLADNLLSGELTDCWNDWKSLLQVNLGNNNLTGTIPHSMGSLSNLLSLHLDRNRLFGVIPLSLEKCQNLWILNLADNTFSGAIPSWMQRSVKVLLLRSNQFSGKIPSRICQLNSLLVMDFASNRLSGPIPNCLHNITNMLSGQASLNTFFITIHTTTGSALKLRFSIPIFIKGNVFQYLHVMNGIDLSSNNLSGSVPLELYMLTGLQSLNLSHNQLVGTISQEIGNLKQLEAVDLSSNHFSGEIPQSLSSLHYLGVLNLSYNNFVGKIPSGTQLGSTNLSYIGNPYLCGNPLTKICPEDEKSLHAEPIEEKYGDDKSEIYSCFYMGLGVGFAVGFLGVLGAIFFNRTCRHGYLRFLYRLYAMVIQK